jgi:glycosyl transferase family 25
MNIFVVHYDKLIERRQNMIRQLLINDLEAEFVIQYNRNNISDNDENLFSTNKIQTNRNKAITLSHLYCYREIADKYDYALVLEDDAIFNYQFKEKLDKYISQLPNDWDMLFIGDGCNLHIPYDIVNKSNTNIFKKCLEPTLWGGNGATRCTDSYLISKKCASKIIEFIEHTKIDNAIDWWLNDVCRKHHFNVYWAEPTIVSQGSEIGIFKPAM